MLNNVDENIIKLSNQYILNKTTATIQLNAHHIDGFECTSGLRQGETLSTIVCRISINDYAQGIKSKIIGDHMSCTNCYSFIFKWHCVVGGEWVTCC